MKAIITKYLGPTDRRGARIKASDMDGNQITVAYEHALNADRNHARAAIALIRKMEWSVRTLRGGATASGYAWVMDDWHLVDVESLRLG